MPRPITLGEAIFGLSFLPRGTLAELLINDLCIEWIDSGEAFMSFLTRAWWGEPD